MLHRFLIRLFWSITTLIGVAVLTFALVNLLPGDVAKIIAGSKASPEVLESIRRQHHLNEPALTRLALYLGKLAQGDLGYSYITDQSVGQAIATRLPTTASLAFLAVIFWMSLATPLGVLTARHRGSWFDRFILVAATLSLSLPAFWLARTLQYLFAYKLGWFPVAGFTSLSHLLLPAITLAVLYVGYYARLIHSNMIEVMDSHYVRAARAKGMNESTVLVRHALSNALLPVVTILGMDVAGLLGGVMFTENVFALPGIGTLAVQSVLNLDVPMILGTVLFSAAVIVAANLVVDLSYRWLDPRIKEAS